MAAVSAHALALASAACLSHLHSLRITYPGWCTVMLWDGLFFRILVCAAARSTCHIARAWAACYADLCLVKCADWTVIMNGYNPASSLTEGLWQSQQTLMRLCSSSASICCMEYGNLSFTRSKASWQQFLNIRTIHPTANAEQYRLQHAEY